MIFDTDPLSDLKKQGLIYCNNILSNFSVETRTRISNHSFLHNIFIIFFAKGG